MPQCQWQPVLACQCHCRFGIEIFPPCAATRALNCAILSASACACTDSFCASSSFLAACCLLRQSWRLASLQISHPTQHRPRMTRQQFELIQVAAASPTIGSALLTCYVIPSSFPVFSSYMHLIHYLAFAAAKESSPPMMFAPPPATMRSGESSRALASSRRATRASTCSCLCIQCKHTNHAGRGGGRARTQRWVVCKGMVVVDG